MTGHVQERAPAEILRDGKMDCFAAELTRLSSRKPENPLSEPCFMIDFPLANWWSHLSSTSSPLVRFSSISDR